MKNFSLCVFNTVVRNYFVIQPYPYISKFLIARMMSSLSSEHIVQENLKFVLKSIEEACTKSTLSKNCQLVAVSKTKPADLVKVCYSIGQRHFGENYVQELEEKSAILEESCPEIKWHYIGQIQSNKIAKICSCPALFCVESIENKKQCDIFEREMSKRQRVLNVLVQVNTSEESQKGGVSLAEASSLANYIRSDCSSLRFAGFMTIGSFENSHVIPNPDFDRLYNVRREWAKFAGESPEVAVLSMGMSEDYLSAIEQGSTSVRVGSKIFGPRIYK